MKDWNSVLKTCQDGLKRRESELTSSSRVKLLYRAGFAHLELSHKSEAEKILRSALKIEPSNSAVKTLLQRCVQNVAVVMEKKVEEKKVKVEEKKVTEEKNDSKDDDDDDDDGFLEELENEVGDVTGDFGGDDNDDDIDLDDFEVDDF